jgi:iron(II)-dependent oxidoreductase
VSANIASMIATLPATIQAFEDTRERTLALVSALEDAELERVHSPLMSPLVWDLGHIAAFEDLWLGHRFGGQPLLREDLAGIYDAFETPRAHRGELAMLTPGPARAYMQAVRERTWEVLQSRGVGDGALAELVLRHEQQHTETMLQTLQLAGLNGSADVTAPEPAAPSPGFTGLEFVKVPGGGCTLGAAPGRFAYDNERPRHRSIVAAFLIARTPVTNASWRRFTEGGGYERREWWSDEGWAWKEQYDITRPGGWTADHRAERRRHEIVAIDPSRPVVHVTWFEADAFARAHEARLPTEAEWEKAATWDHQTQAARRFPWGEEPITPGVHANVDQRWGGTAPVGAYPAGASPVGCLGMIGDVWEWTTSVFSGYPGFVAEPYREYSEVFFGHGFRVLRGGSWATQARTVTATFRNWDYPERRQIFSGLRLARDV